MLSRVPVEICWDQIKPGVESIIKISNSKDRPEDVYSLIKSGQAHVFISDEGFLILQEKGDSLTINKVLFVYGAYAFDGKQDFLKRNMDQFMQIAKEIKATKVQFLTKHKALPRLLGEGWNVVHYVVEKEINGKL